MVSRAEYIKVTAGLVTTAFAFVAGLAWNQAILAIITYFLGSPNSPCKSDIRHFGNDHRGACDGVDSPRGVESGRRGG